MKTVKEIALDLEVSQVTVYNHIKKLDKELKGNIFKKQGTTYLDSEGIRQIKISMGLIQVPVVKEYKSTDDIVKDISDLVIENVSANISEQVSANINQKMDKLEQQIQDLKEQNKLLIELVQEQQQKKSIFNWFRK